MAIDAPQSSRPDPAAPRSAPVVPPRRVCFELRVRPERVAEYRRRHAAVWPEMLLALRDAGCRNYSLFLRADGLLIGYLETADLAAAQAAMAATDVNARWQAEMGEFFVDLDGAPDTGFAELVEVFNLDTQLAALDTPAPPRTPAPSMEGHPS